MFSEKKQEMNVIKILKLNNTYLLSNSTCRENLNTLKASRYTENRLMGIKSRTEPHVTESVRT